MALVEVKVPDIGDFKEVEVIELLVKAGDTIAAEQSLLTVESDKASMEIPSSHGGVVRELRVKLGDKVAEGTVVLVLEVAGAGAAPEPAPATVRAEPALPSTGSGQSGIQAQDDRAPAPSASASPSTSSGPTEAVTVVVPDIGDFDEVAVIEVFVKVGDGVKVEQSLITVESDKASMEIPSSHAGSVTQLLVKVGDKVKKGSPVLMLQAAGSAGVSPVRAEPVSPTVQNLSKEAPASTTVIPSAATSAPAASGSASSTRTETVPAHQPTAAASGKLPHASPSIRRLARELGVALAEVQGSGPNGRITQLDVQGFVKGVMAGDRLTQAQKAKTPPASATTPAAAGGSFPGLLAWPQVDFAKFGAIERKDLSRIKKISGANLHRNWVVIPHVTNHDDCDITELEAFRVQLNKENEKAGVKVTMLAFMIKAAVAALKKFPEFNASLDGEQIVLKSYFNIGFAADTPNGLMVPVIKNADQKGVFQISAEMGELAKKARDGKLGPAEMSGGCFSISSLGGIGGRYFTPIINAPEVSIMGVCKSSIEPQWDGEKFVPRLMLPLSLSWDHRVIDGAAAARFNVFFGQVMTDFRRVLL